MIPAIMTCKSLRNSFIMIVMMTVKSFWLIIKQDHKVVGFEKGFESNFVTFLGPRGPHGIPLC